MKKHGSPFRLDDHDDRGKGGVQPDTDDAKKTRGAPFYAAKGSDQNAAMKNDIAQQVPRSTAPGTKPKRPAVKAGGAYKLSATKPKKVAPPVPRVKLNA